MLWVEAVMRDRAVHPSAKNVAFMLARHQNDKTLRCDPSNARLGDEVGMDATNVSRAINALHKAGWIGIVRRSGKRNAYDLVRLDDSAASSTPPTFASTLPPMETHDTPHANEGGPPTFASTEPVFNQHENQQEAAAPNQPQANEVRKGGVGEVEVIERFPGGEAEAVEVDGATVSFGDDIASLDGDSIAVRHDALSGECEPPRGGQPEIAVGDQGEAEEVGVDEPVPSLPRAPASVVTPVRKAPRRLTPEDFDISSEKLERMRRNLRKERGLDMWAMVEQQNDLFVSLPKWKRDDLLKKIIDEAMRANDNDDPMAKAI